MTEMTQDEALRQADALAGRALKETEARCTVLGQFINDCERTRPRPATWPEALRELRSLQDRRRGLVRRRSLIREALDIPVGGPPATVPLAPPPDRTGQRTQRQVQIQVQRRG